MCVYPRVYVSMNVMYYEFMNECLEICALIYWTLNQYGKISLISQLKGFFSKTEILQGE